MGNNHAVVNVTRERFFRKVRIFFEAKAKMNMIPTTREIKSFLVPCGIQNTAFPGSFGNGRIFKYEFLSSDGEVLMVKYHATDMRARTKHPGCNAGKGWTCQIMVGRGVYITFDYATGKIGTCTDNWQNAVHIPVICDLDKDEKRGNCQSTHPLFFYIFNLENKIIKKM